MYEAIRRANQARANREVLARIGAHSLRDIGLQSWNADLANRLAAKRQQRLLRLAASRIGTY